MTGASATRRATAGVSVVIPNWNGREWLGSCLQAVMAGSHRPDEVIVVDNGSHDGSVEYLHAEHPAVRVLMLGTNTGFAFAANRGIEAAEHEFVAMLNPDVVVANDWLERMVAALDAHPQAGSVTGKMLALQDPTVIYDAGDILRRDGACQQRGRFRSDDGRFDQPGWVFGACAGAAVYRRAPVLELGGFDQRFFAYLEDVDLALRLGLAGWLCRYEPAVSHHAGEAASRRLPGGHHALVTRNTILLVAKAFPSAWLGPVTYRQLAWAGHAVRERRLRAHLRALSAAAPLLPSALRDRRRLRRRARVPIERIVPPRPFRGPRAAGHPDSPE